MEGPTKFNEQIFNTQQIYDTFKCTQQDNHFLINKIND